MFENSLHYTSFPDRQCVERTAEEYDSLVLQSHIVIGGQGKIPTLLNRLYKEENVDFYIDPAITQLRVGDYFRDEGDLTQYWEKWANYVGEPVSSHLEENRHLRFEDFSKREREAISERLCDFQENFVRDIAQDKSGKYDSVPSDFGPKAVVPWYKKITGVSDIEDNHELIKHFQQFSERPVKPCIFITKEFLKKKNAVLPILDMLTEVEVSGVFLWVEGLNKDNTSTTEYISTIELVNELSNQGIDPHFLYGNYFANLLRYFGLKGTGFGKFFLESKSEKKQGGGGGDLTRYYFEPVQEFLSIPDVNALIETKEPELCQCKACQQEMSDWSDIFRVGDDRLFLQHHFVSTKRFQKEQPEKNDLEELLQKLETARNTYSSALESTNSSKNAYHLPKWRASIEHYVTHELNKDISDFEAL